MKPRICQPQPGILVEGIPGVFRHATTFRSLPSKLFVPTHAAFIIQIWPPPKSI
jgi:hypothetical protein